MKRLLTLTLGCALILAGCAGSAPRAVSLPGDKASGGVPPPRFEHVFLIVLENREYDPGQDPPFLTGLARAGAASVNYYAVTHPSLPNYLALISGRTFGITSDSTSVTLKGETVVGQLEQVGMSWKAYMEGMPKPCFRGVQSGRYVKRHNPFMYFASIRNDTRRCARVQPLAGLYADLESGTIPNFVWITPDLCHDGHDCGTDAVNTFLQKVVPRITASPAYHDRGVLFITYDEGNSNAGCCRYAAGGHVQTVFTSDAITGGPRLTTAADHYSLLRTIEDGFGLPHLGHAGCTCSAPLGGAWRR